MTVTFVTPVGLGVGLPADGVLAEWAARVAASGKPVRYVHADALAVERLTGTDAVRDLEAASAGYLASLQAAGDAVAASWLKTRLDAATPDLRAAPEARAALQRAETLRDPAALRRALRTLGAALEFIYQLEPRFDPDDPRFGATAREFVAAPPWTPLAALETDFLVPRLLADDPELVVFRATSPAAWANVLRTTAALRRAPRPPRVLWAGPGLAAAGGGTASDDVAALVDGRCATDDLASFVDAAGALGVRCDVAPDSDAPLHRFDGAADAPPPSYALSLRAPGRHAAPPDAERLRKLVATCVALGPQVVRWTDAAADPADLHRLAEALVAAFGAGAALDDAAPRWGADVRPSRALLSPGFAETLRRGGCRTLTLDVGSAADAVRAAAGDDFPAAELTPLCERLFAAGIAPCVVFRLGAAGEDRGAVLQSLRRLEQACAGRGLAVFGGVEGGLARRYARASHDDWLPHPRPGHLVKEELRPLETMLSPFDVTDWLTAARPTALAAAAGPAAVAALNPFSVPVLVVAFCTPYPAEPAAPRAHFAPTGDQVLFADDFGFRTQLEAAFEDIRAEWNALPRSARIEYRDPGASDGYWAQFGLCGAGMRVPTLRRMAPKLSAALDRVPGLYTAAFSIVGPRTRITPHCGEDRTLLRCHLPIDIPEPSGILVGDVLLPWVEGRTIAFDDTLPHGAWNDADREKVLLMIDFRPACRAAQGLAPTPAQIARDRAHYVHLYPEWAAEAEIDDRR